MISVFGRRLETIADDMFTFAFDIFNFIKVINLKRLNKIYRKPSIISPGLTELFVRFNNGLIHGQEGRGVYTGV
jgi:hypothetical protein